MSHWIPLVTLEYVVLLMTRVAHEIMQVHVPRRPTRPPFAYLHTPCREKHCKFGYEDRGILRLLILSLVLVEVTGEQWMGTYVGFREARSRYIIKIGLIMSKGENRLFDQSCPLRDNDVPFPQLKKYL